MLTDIALSRYPHCQPAENASHAHLAADNRRRRSPAAGEPSVGQTEAPKEQGLPDKLSGTATAVGRQLWKAGNQFFPHPRCKPRARRSSQVP